MQRKDIVSGKFIACKIEIKCLICDKIFLVKESYSKKAKYCSQLCMGKAKREKPGTWVGRKHTEESKKKISENSAMRNKNGELHHNWIQDRNLLKKRNERNDYAYQDWRMKVVLRDSFKCKIANNDCNGVLEVHHILSWRDYYELRYEINNGITLCQAHHPRKRMDEQRLIPEFQKLVESNASQFPA